MSSMLSAPEPKKPDPVTQATEIDDAARRRSDLERRRRKGFYDNFRPNGQNVGGDKQTLG